MTLGFDPAPATNYGLRTFPFPFDLAPATDYRLSICPVLFNLAPATNYGLSTMPSRYNTAPATTSTVSACPLFIDVIYVCRRCFSLQSTENHHQFDGSLPANNSVAARVLLEVFKIAVLTVQDHSLE